MQYHHISAPCRRTFTPEALVTILYATDETADTIVAAVVAHTHARRPRRIPIKLVVIAQRYTPAILEAQVRHSRNFACPPNRAQMA
jgi:hypothetical protein